MLFAVTGERWKHLRSKLSPTFTTGKIKRMFRLFDQNGKKFIKFLETEIQTSANGEVDLLEAYSKFTMDIIALIRLRSSQLVGGWSHCWL